MNRFRKKPVEVEAWLTNDLLHAAAHLWSELPPQVVDAYEKGDVIFANHPPRILIVTLEGTMTADLGDMVICGVQGELYPCKPAIFDATYDRVEARDE